MTDWKKRFDDAYDWMVTDVCESGEIVEWDRVKHFIELELIKAKKEERQKVLALLVDEEENEHAGHEIDVDWCMRCSEAVSGRHPDYEYGRNQLRAELRQQIKEMK